MRFGKIKIIAALCVAFTLILLLCSCTSTLTDKNDFYASYQYDNSTTKSIESLKTELREQNPQIDDLELGKEILLALGDSEEFIETLPEEEILETLNYTVKTEWNSFFKLTEDGDKISIGFDEYNRGVAEVEAKLGKYGRDEDLNSYLRFSTVAYKRQGERYSSDTIYFTLRVDAEWTNPPSHRGTDILGIDVGANIDSDYETFACAYWDDCYDVAHLYKNNRRGSLFSGEALEIVYSTPYTLAVEVDSDSASELSPLKRVCLYYGISTEKDISLRGVYEHSASTFTVDRYLGKIFNLHFEKYIVELVSPSFNQPVSSDTSPFFLWYSRITTPDAYILEIDYSNNGNYFTKTIPHSSSYTLSEEEWQEIVNNTPVINGEKRVRWRIKVNGNLYPGEVYYTDWIEFVISDNTQK